MTHGRLDGNQEELITEMEAAGNDKKSWGEIVSKYSRYTIGVYTILVSLGVGALGFDVLDAKGAMEIVRESPDSILAHLMQQSRTLTSLGLFAAGSAIGSAGLGIIRSAREEPMGVTYSDLRPELLGAKNLHHEISSSSLGNEPDLLDNEE